MKKKGMKTVDCREGCGNQMEISEDARAGTCWRCVNKMMANPISEYQPVHREINEGDQDQLEENNN